MHAKLSRRRRTEQDGAALTQLMAGRHHGSANGIGAAGLAKALGWTERRLRLAVSHLREQGAPICGHPRTGYYIAANAAELDEAARFLEHRAMHSLRLLARMRQVSLPALLGQLKLPT